MKLIILLLGVCNFSLAHVLSPVKPVESKTLPPPGKTTDYFSVHEGTRPNARRPSRETLDSSFSSRTLSPPMPVPHRLFHSSDPELQKIKKNKSESQKAQLLPADSSEAQTAICDLEGFRENTESALAEHIQNMSKNCLDQLFTSAPKETRADAFRLQNMLYILQAVEEISQIYSGANIDIARKYFLFIRIGYYNRFYNDLLDWREGGNKERVDSASHQAVTAFTSNSHFLNISNEHGLVFREVVLLTYSLEIADYLPAFKKHLAQFSMEYVNHRSMLLAVDGIFEGVYRGCSRESFISIIEEDVEFVTLLTHLSLSDEYLETDADFIVDNAAGELARLIQYDKGAIYPFVISGIRSIFNKYDPIGKGAGPYTYVLTLVLHHEKCDVLSVCGLVDEIKSQVLSIRHECPEVPVIVRAQGLSDEQIDLACESLLLTDNYFHEKLKTNKIPLQDDFNDKIEAVVFINWDNYNMYSTLFFENPTDNSGVYWEGDSSDADNAALLITYTSDADIHDSPFTTYTDDWWIHHSKPIWSLEHEYVHYLDSRFIRSGTLGNPDSGIVGWAEGLAEYISKQNNNTIAKWFYRRRSENPFNLSDILQADYDSPPDIIYYWNYFAIRFLFENHPHEIDRFKSYFMNGQYDEYVSYVKNNISTYDDDFKDWLWTTFSQPDTRPVTIPHNVGKLGYATINLWYYFLRLENNTVTVHSSDPNTVEVEIGGTYIYISPKSVGSAEITMQAEISGKLVEVSFTVNVVPGDVLSDIEEQTFPQGSTEFIMDLRKYFVVYKNSSFTVESSDENVVETVHYDGYLLTFKNNGIGSARITVTMQDGENIVTKSFIVNVVKSPLTITKIRDYGILPVGKTMYFDLSWYYKGPPNEDVQFEIQYFNDNIVSATLQGSLLKIKALSPASTLIKIFTIYNGIKYSEWFRVRAVNSTNVPNAPIQFRGIPGAVHNTLKTHKTSHTINLSNVFYTEDENSRLVYRASSSHPDQISTHIDENQSLIIEKLSPAETTAAVSILLMAETPSGEYLFKEFFIVMSPYTIPLFLSTKDSRKQSFIRIINNSNENGNILITARDSSGVVKDTVSLSMDALEAKHFNSQDLEDGSPSKGLTGSIGTGEKDLYLTLTSDLDFHASSYIRTQDGFLTSMNHTADLLTGINHSNSVLKYSDEYHYFIPIFNPASNQNQQSVLKLVNPHSETAKVRFIGIDDTNLQSSDPVELHIPPHGMSFFNSQDLESYAGDGQGKWRVIAKSSRPLHIVNLIENPTGHLSNLSYNPTTESSAEEEYFSRQVLLFPRLEERRHGFVRIINNSYKTGAVRLTVEDSSGNKYGSIRMLIGPNEAKQFNANHLENGGGGLGTVQGLGAPQGMWRLHFESHLDISVLNYMRSKDGFLTSLDGELLKKGDEYKVDFFNPAGNQNQKSMLEIFNPHDSPVTVSIIGVDDQGRSSEGTVSFTVPADSSKLVSSQELESGEGLTGALGDGSGKWRLSITADKSLSILNLLESPNGYISNLSQ